MVPAHYSTLPRLFAERLLPGEVGLVQVAPPDRDGLCSLGIGADYAADAVAHSRVLIAEINERMPRTTGTPGIPRERFAAVVETDRPLAPVPDRAPDAVDEAIAAHVAGLVADGDTVQIGVGALPTAILAGLSGHRDLGFHAGMLTDGVARLAERGVITGARKEIDRGVLVTGTAVGGPALYDRLPDTPVDFRPASYTHAPAVLARLRRLVSINSRARGRPHRPGRRRVRARPRARRSAARPTSPAPRRAPGPGRSSPCARSAGGRSTVVAGLSGPVTTARADVDVVVTEHGVAHLRGCPLGARLRAWSRSAARAPGSAQTWPVSICTVPREGS